MRRLLPILCLLLLTLQVVAQNRVVTGTVTSTEDGLPIPGVSVKLKGTTAGTQTGPDGRYSISVPSITSVLQFSFIGFAPREIVAASATVNVALTTDVSLLNEVVITGLGISREKKTLGYATAQVTADEVTKAAPINIANGLQGKVSGLNITSINNGVFENVKINLRGIRSLTGNNNPLLVIDGVPSDLSYLSSLNPNDIENTSILKGASAAAIYGPDARNGVILVTTKKGSKDDQPVIAFSQATQATQISFFPKFQDKFGSGGGNEYIPYENWSWGPAFDGTSQAIGDALPDGKEEKVPYSPNNSRKEFFNTGVTTQNDFSLSAKDFYISIQDANVKGIVPDDKNRRTSLRLNASKEYGKFKVALNNNYIQQNYNVFDDGAMASWNSGNNVGLNQGLMNLIFNTPAQIPLNKYSDFETGAFSQYNTFFNHYGLNPYFALDNWRQGGKREDIITNLDLSLKATDWLSLTYRAGLLNQTVNERRTSEGEVPNSFGLPRGAKLIPGSVEERSFRSSRLSSEAFANINKDINENFRLNAVLGTYVRQNEARDTRTGVTSLVVPELFNVANRVGELTGSSPYSRTRLFSYYASAGLSYKGWANIEVTGRNDKTSVLGSNNNSFFYPGVSGSLVLSEAFSALSGNGNSFIKLRGSWTKTGNADIGAYQLAATFSQASGFPYGSLPGFTANNTIYDPNLEPEFIESKEIGLETSWFKNRLSVEATYYYQDNTNQIMPISVSSATGYTSSFVNAAYFVNRGAELDVKVTPIANVKGVTFNFNANLAYNDSEVKSIYSGLDELFIGGYTSAANYAIKGYPAFVNKATDYVRDKQGRVVVDATTGVPTENPNTQIFGRTMPKWLLGLNPSVNFKGVNLSALFEYRGGHYSYHDIGTAMAWTGVSEATAVNNRERYVFPNSSILQADGTYKANTNVTINKFEDFYTGVYRDVATNFITSAASGRLREVALSYNIPTSLLSKQNLVKAVNVSITGRNMALWLPKSNVYTDPDFNFTTGNTSGISNSQINPPTRVFGFNVNLTF